MFTSEWLICPICGRKTHNKVRKDTEMKNFPLYCPKCKQESLIDVKDFKMEVHKGFETDYSKSY